VASLIPAQPTQLAGVQALGCVSRLDSAYRTQQVGGRPLRDSVSIEKQVEGQICW